jgi:hypothetical protein
VPPICPLSFGWQGHDVVVAKIAGAGEAAAVAALRRQWRAGAVVAACTLTVTNNAYTVADLEDPTRRTSCLMALAWMYPWLKFLLRVCQEDC